MVFRGYSPGILVIIGLIITIPSHAAQLPDAAAESDFEQVIQPSERAIHDSLVEVNLDVNSEPIKRGGSITLSSNPFRDGLTNGRATLNSADEGSLTPPAENHVYVIGHLAIDAGIDFELNHGDDLYLQAADGQKYSPDTKLPLIGWVTGGTEHFYAGSKSRRIEVFFEVPGAAANGAKVVFFGKQFELHYAKTVVTNERKNANLKAGPLAALIEGGEIFRVGGDVTAPELIYKVDPEYSEEALNAKREGTIVLHVVVQRDGTIRDIKVADRLGLGLDEKAIEAVRQWRFRPGMKGNTPVNVAADITVSFQLK